MQPVQMLSKIFLLDKCFFIFWREKKNKKKKIEVTSKKEKL